MKLKIIFLIIVLLTFFLRIYKVNQYPMGLNADEAALGYNAYSLLKTGRDEFGHPWPINFQSFNDWKPGFYVYLTIPFVAILGLNEWAVRLPSVILGSLTVAIVYFLAKKIFQEKKAFFPIAAAFLLAISPWHLHFSRGAWETNVATFLITLGIYFFYLALEKPKYYFLSVLSLVLSMFTYHSARVVAPLLGLGIFIFYWRKIFTKENFRQLVLSSVFGVFSLGVLFFSMTGQAGTSRFSGVGIFADQGPLGRLIEMRDQHTEPYSLWSKILHNKVLEYFIQFGDNYLRHFGGNFLFISGDEIQRNRVPEMGQMYLLEAPFLILGFYFLLKKRPQNYQFIFWWLAVAPVASAMTFQSPHAIRALNMVVPLTLIAAYGLVNSLSFLKKELSPIFYFVAFGLLVLVYSWNFGFYLHQYYVHYPQTYPYAWEGGFRDLVSYIQSQENRFEKIYVTNHYDQPYILFAFYLKYPPEKLQKEAKLTSRDQFSFSTVTHFGKFYFGPIDRERLAGERNAMIVGTPEEISESATIVKRINLPKAKEIEAFRITEQ